MMCVCVCVYKKLLLLLLLLLLFRPIASIDFLALDARHLSQLGKSERAVCSNRLLLGRIGSGTFWTWSFFIG
ncbi:hypothetical protein V8C26DRAFT_394861, partial [Trichoderma gracile]